MTSESQEPKEPREPETDAVDAAFRAMRAAARRRGGRLPDLAAQGRSVRPRRSVAKPLAARDASTSGEKDAGPVIPGFTQFADLSGADRRAVLGTRGQWRAGSRGRPSGPDGRRMRRSYSVPRLGAVLGKEIEDRGWEHDLAAGWVVNHWAELVGEKIAQHTTIEMIKDKRVHITCDSTAWATNLKYMQRTILEQIAAKVGPDVIVALRIYGPQTKSWRKGPLHVKGRGPRDTYG